MTLSLYQGKTDQVLPSVPAGCWAVGRTVHLPGLALHQSLSPLGAVGRRAGSTDSPAALCSSPQGHTAKFATAKTLLLCCLHSAGVWRPLLAQLRRGNARTDVRVGDFPALEKQNLSW